MGRTMSEAQVLKKLEIADFRHLTKDKVMSMATMLDKMDPEVAKKALEQFPEFASTMRQMLSDYKQSLDEGMRQNAEGVKSYYDACDAIITSCQKELEKENLSFAERRYILEQMVQVAKMKDEKDSENKHFILKVSVLHLAAVGLTACAMLAVLGGNFQIDTDVIKRTKA